jgi:hypothetical protein
MFLAAENSLSGSVSWYVPTQNFRLSLAVRGISLARDAILSVAERDLAFAEYDTTLRQVVRR